MAYRQKNVSRILEVGSRKPYLQNIAVDIKDRCDKNQVMNTKWILMELNTEADFLSKCCDSDDWQVSKQVFDYVNIKWG